MRFKVQPFDHQLKALAFCDPLKHYALLMEQGTGKTAVAILDAARRWLRGEIRGLIVWAPNGVHTNWIERELETHLPEGIPYRAAAFYSSPRAEEREEMARLLADPRDPALRVLALNWESLITKVGLKAALDFINLFEAIMAAGDESQRIKNPNAQRTKALMKLKPLLSVRVIMSGTAIVNSPWDAFSQFGFLDSRILRIQSYSAFKSEYAEMLPPDHGLMRHITQHIRHGIEARIRPRIEAKYSGEFLQKTRDALWDTPSIQSAVSEEAAEEMINERIKALIDSAVAAAVDSDPELLRRMPKMVDKKSDGTPKWRNLEKLDALIAPHSFRVLKKDCLDLPEKVYSTQFFRMTPKQLAAYRTLRDDLRVQLADGRIAPMERIATLTKLSQVVSGYFIVPGTKDQLERIMDRDDNPKLDALMEIVEDTEGKGIIWARFHAELEDIVYRLRKAGKRCVEYHGGVARAKRNEAIDLVQSGDADWFVGQQAAGGTGITLTRAATVIYYSNTWSLEDRLQSEDRAHRIGQERNVRYIDLIAKRTIDERVVTALRAKKDVAQIVLGDARRAAEMLQ